MDKLREALQEAMRQAVEYDGLDVAKIGPQHWYSIASAALAEPVADEPPVAYLFLSGESGKSPIALSLDTPEVTRVVLDAFPVYTRPAAAPAERGEYPPLPEPYCREFRDPKERYTADQMRAYVDADRAQRVPLLQREIFDLWDDARFAEGSSVEENFARAIERAHGIGAKP